VAYLFLPVMARGESYYYYHGHETTQNLLCNSTFTPPPPPPRPLRKCFVLPSSLIVVSILGQVLKKKNKNGDFATKIGAHFWTCLLGVIMATTPFCWKFYRILDEKTQCQLLLWSRRELTGIGRIRQRPQHLLATIVA
jgi:hypothetical protein